MLVCDGGFGLESVTNPISLSQAAIKTRIRQIIVLRMDRARRESVGRRRR
jgi:hypothetical protein